MAYPMRTTLAGGSCARREFPDLGKARYQLQPLVEPQPSQT
jgi:hypothetical protein